MPGLVREDHALFNDTVALLALHIPVYALRALMHAEDEAHAVACAVVEVEARFPQRRARQHVKVFAHAAVQELGRAQLYVSAQDKRVDALFLVRERPPARWCG